MRGKDYYLSAEYREQQERNNEFPNMCDDDDRMRKDRLADYAPRPLIPANTIRFANSGKYWEDKD